MPIISQDKLLAETPITSEGKNPIQMQHVMDYNDPLADVFGSAFESENMVGARILQNKMLGDIPISGGSPLTGQREVEENFNFALHVPLGYEQYAPMYAYINSPDEAKKVTNYIDQLLHNQEVIQRNGLTGLAASMVAGTVDPTIIVPGISAVKGAWKGANLARGAIQGGSAGLFGVGIQEAALQSAQQDTRSLETSVYATLGGMVLGGTMGGFISALPKGTRKTATIEIADALDDTPANIKISDDGMPSMDTYKKIDDAESLGRLNANLAKVFTGPKALQSFSFRTVTAPNGTIKKIGNGLFDHNFTLGKEVSGEVRGEVFERALAIDEGRLIKANGEVNRLYLDYVGVPKEGQELSQGAAFLKAKVTGKLSWNEFDKEVGKAMRRGDRHSIPEVQQAAQKYRSILNKVTARMQELKILPEGLDPKTAESYFTRRYNTKLIKQNYNEFVDLTKTWLKEQNPEWGDIKAVNQAREITRNILGLGDQSLALSDLVENMTGGAGKFTKERVFLIPDERIEKFLDSRASTVNTSYISQADSIIRFQEFLERNGWKTTNDARKEVTDEFLKRLSEATDPKAIRRINEDMNEWMGIDKDIGMLNKTFRVALGHYSPGSNAGVDSALRTLRKYQVYRLLGGVTISSLPDVSMHLFKHGAHRTWQDGLLPMIRNLEASKMTKDELLDFHVGLELEENTMLRNLTDPDFRAGSRQSNIEKGLDSLSQVYGKATLLTYWNRANKRIAGQVSQARTIRVLKKLRDGFGITGKESLRLRKLNISDEMGDRILKQFDEFGEESGGSFITHLDKWTDTKARDAFGNAIRTDVDSTILTPGRGDLPDFAIRSEIGKTIFQFKSFSSTATNKLLLSSLDRRDAEVLQGLIGLISMGAMTYTIKERIAGRKPDMSIDNLLLEGISRSGVIGLLGDYEMGLGNFFLGFEGSSRYAGRNMEGLIFGPSADIVGESFDALAGVKDGEINEWDKKKIKRLLPFSSLFYIRLLLKKASEDKFNDN